MVIIGLGMSCITVQAKAHSLTAIPMVPVAPSDLLYVHVCIHVCHVRRVEYLVFDFGGVCFQAISYTAMAMVSQTRCCVYLYDKGGVGVVTDKFRVGEFVIAVHFLGDRDPQECVCC
jgi:hypothetical protein